uniref:Uncharacterized protein n=1 Tax=Paracidobacterium acidisoli TaxID=2303751 RepID=A0A372IMP0_9BACT
MQVRNRQSASGILISGRLHTIFTVNSRENNLLPILPELAKGSGSPFVGQAVQESAYDAKNTFCSFLGMSYLNGQCSRMSDSPEKKPSGNPRAHAHLPSLENDILSGLFLFEFVLYSVAGQRSISTCSVSDTQYLFGKRQIGKSALHISMVKHDPGSN